MNNITINYKILVEENNKKRTVKKFKTGFRDYVFIHKDKV